MLKIEGKTFMNIQEAVQWLLDNNALPFQSSANYVANTEIGLGTIANPSPAKVRIGSLILFADSKVATVSGLTDSGFMVGTQYVNIKDALAYVSNIYVGNNGHLITQFSDGSEMDAGIIKQVDHFEINASQHLIAVYNTGETTDLGAIFSGNITISGDLTVTGDATGPKADFNLVTGEEIVEKMSGYGFTKENDSPTVTYSWIYAGIVKNGNKLTTVVALNFTKLADAGADVGFGNFILPAEIRAKLYPSNIGGYSFLDVKKASAIVNQSNSVEVLTYTTKNATGTAIGMSTSQFNALTTSETYYLRIEETFLLSENLAS